MSEKIRVFCKLYLGYAAIVLTCVAYVATSIIRLEETGRTLSEILLSGVMAFALGMLIAGLFKTQGLLSGAREPEVAAAVTAHEAVVEEVGRLDGMEALDDWCVRQNARNYRMQRTKILSKEGLSYTQCFTDGGTALHFEPDVPRVGDIKELGARLWFSRRRTAKRQMRAYRRAVELKLTELSAGELTGEGGKYDDPFWMGRGVGEYTRQTTASDIVSKVLTSVVLGYYGAELVSDFSFGDLFWKLIQVAFFVVVGSMKYQGAVSYMVDEHRERREKKVRHIQKFLNEFGRSKGASNHEHEQCGGIRSAGNVSAEKPIGGGQLSEHGSGEECEHGHGSKDGVG